MRPSTARCLENPSEPSKDHTRTTPELRGILPEGRAARHSTSELDCREPFAPNKGCGPVLDPKQKCGHSNAPSLSQHPKSISLTANLSRVVALGYFRDLNGRYTPRSPARERRLVPLRPPLLLPLPLLLLAVSFDVQRQRRSRVSLAGQPVLAHFQQITKDHLSVTSRLNRQLRTQQQRQPKTLVSS